MINSELSVAKKPDSQRKETVNAMQASFLSQISEGKDAKEAFYNSLKTVNKKYNPEQDEVRFESCKGEIAKAGAKLTPEDAKKWLEVIAMVGPLVAAFVDWIESKLPNNQNNEQPQTA